MKMTFAGKIRIVLLMVCIRQVTAAGSCEVDVNDFAIEVVSSTGPFGGDPYDDPCSVLGKPTTEIYDPSYFDTFCCSLVYPACYTDANNNKLVTTLGNGAAIVVKFDHEVADDPCNPYGVDFIVFGNSFFENGGDLEPGTNMENYFLTNPISVYEEPVIVSVSPDGNDWYEYSTGPYADTAFPTNAYAWDRENDCWGAELDWTRPVDPNLSESDFDGLSAADAIDLYNGSAGGTGFDLAESGFEWIRYVKVQSDYFGEIDGFADAAGCGDYKHPYPAGDLNKDCLVDFIDLVILTGQWRQSSGELSADIAPDGGDGVVGLNDLFVLTGSWLQCSWECE